MAQHVLRPLKTADSPDIIFFGTPVSLADLMGPQGPILVGTTDPGEALQVRDDGKSFTIPPGSGGPTVVLWAYFEDDAFLPPVVTINSVQVVFYHRADPDGAQVNGTFAAGTSFYGPKAFLDPAGAVGTSTRMPLTVPPEADFDVDPPQEFALMNSTSAVMAVNPFTGNPWARPELFANPDQSGQGVWFIEVATPDTANAYFWDFFGLIVDYVDSGSGWFLSPDDGYQFFDTDPGPPWVRSIVIPNLPAMTQALNRQPCPWFLPTFLIQLTDPMAYANFVNTYGFGTPLILGMSPNDAVIISGAPLNQDPSNAARSMWPQVYVDPAAPFVLGVAISLGDGGGRVNVSYATPFGRKCSYSLWKWQALVQLVPGGVTYTTQNPAPPYSMVVIPPGDFAPDGALLTGVGFGEGRTTPCGCPEESV